MKHNNIIKAAGMFFLSAGLLASCGGGDNKDQTFTISFEPNGGSAVASITVKNGEKAKKPADPVKLGDTFLGWCVDEALKVDFDWDQEITADWKLYANWSGGSAESSEAVTTEEGTSEEVTTEETSQGQVTTEADPTSQQQSEGGVPTAEGYYVVVAGVTYVPLTGGQPWSYDPSYVEYSALGVHVEQDQAISFYHVNEQGEGASWNSMAIDPASKGNWVQGESGIICGETNDYDMYVKMKFEADNIYFGYHAAE